MPVDSVFPESEPNKDSPHEDLVKKQLYTDRPVSAESPKSESDKSIAQESLNTILDLHTSPRMRSASPGKKLKHGVSIPTQ